MEKKKIKRYFVRNSANITVIRNVTKTEAFYIANDLLTNGDKFVTIEAE